MVSVPLSVFGLPPPVALRAALFLAVLSHAGGARIDLVHANIPDYAYAGIRTGWGRYYWKPWKVYLKGWRP